MDRFEQIVELLAGAQEHDGGKYYSALCPFHSDSSPSLMVWRANPPYFHCLGCGEKGGLGKLLRQLQGWSAPPVDSKKSHFHSFPLELDEQEELCYSAHSMLMRNYDPLANYLIRRGVGKMIEPCKLGYSDGWYTIPIYSEQGDFIGMVGRASPDKQKVTGMRFDTPKQQLPLLYVPDWKLVNESEYLVAVFGMFDALCLSSIGLPGCTATAGKESTKPHLLETFRKPIYVIPDKGEEDTAENLVNKLGWRGRMVTVTYPDTCKDPADLVQNNLTELLIGSINKVKI